MAHKTGGFGRGVQRTFAPTARDVLMTTLRDLLAQPEREEAAGFRQRTEERAISREEREVKTSKRAKEAAERKAKLFEEARTPEAKARQKELADLSLKERRFRLEAARKKLGKGDAKAKRASELGAILKGAVEEASKEEVTEGILPELPSRDEVSSAFALGIGKAATFAIQSNPITSSILGLLRLFETSSGKKVITKSRKAELMSLGVTLEEIDANSITID